MTVAAWLWGGVVRRAAAVPVLVACVIDEWFPEPQATKTVSASVRTMTSRSVFQVIMRHLFTAPIRAAMQS